MDGEINSKRMDIPSVIAFENFNESTPFNLGKPFANNDKSLSNLAGVDSTCCGVSGTLGVSFSLVQVVNGTLGVSMVQVVTLTGQLPLKSEDFYNSPFICSRRQNTQMNAQVCLFVHRATY
jgi:hypothetical protein